MLNELKVSEKNSFLTKCFLQMFIGLVVTFLTMIYISSDGNLLWNVARYFRVIVIGQIAMVLIVSSMLHKLSSFAVKLYFVAYSVLTGVLFSGIGMIYQFSSIVMVLLATSTIFIVMAIYGKVTKEDLSTYSSFFKGGLIALLIVSVINLFLGITFLGWAISVFAVVLFTGLIAYDVNRIIKTYEDNNFTVEEYSKFTTLAAFTLYLDFINLFIHLLRLFGKKR